MLISLRGSCAFGLALPSEGVATPRKVHTSTVALVPPDAAWPPLQAARAQLQDKGLYRWPPHINLLYPFVPSEGFADAIGALAPAVGALRPFEVELDGLGVFGGRSRGVLYCHPTSTEQTERLCELQAALQLVMPSCDDQQRIGSGRFVPHLTLSHFPSADAAEQARQLLLESGWAPGAFLVATDAVHIMRRLGGDGQFERACTLPLGTAGAMGGTGEPPSPPVLLDPCRPFVGMPTEEAEWIRELRRAGKQRGRGGFGGRGGRASRRRAPRRTPEEREAIRNRTPEDIERIRSERAAKRAAAQASE